MCCFKEKSRFLPGLILPQVPEARDHCRHGCSSDVQVKRGVEVHHHLHGRLWGPGVEGEVQKGQTDVFPGGRWLCGVFFPDGF